MFAFYNEKPLGVKAREAANAMPVILENGRKVFGPPPNFKGPRPSYLCELYVSRIPEHLDELTFLVWLHRIGRVYDFRLMMDTGNVTRGYAFVRFCSEREALAAFELLKYMFLAEGQERLRVYRSQGKNRLFISCIPRQISLESLETDFKKYFPEMQSCTAYPPLNQNMMAQYEQNRGFAFIEFIDHESALEAKKRFTPGRFRMLEVDLKLQWAKPKDEMKVATSQNNANERRTRNRFQSNACMPNDFCAKLRLYCLANNLCIPIVLYGPSFQLCHLQYAGILLKNANTRSYSMIIFEICFARMSDIHLLMCELAIKIIERQSGQCHQHALFRVINETNAELVHVFTNHEELHSINLLRMFRKPKAITDLAISLDMLAGEDSVILFKLYRHSFIISNVNVAEFKIKTKSPYGKFYSVLPKFRNNTKLNNNFNDAEIILLQNPRINQPPISLKHMPQLVSWKINDMTVNYQQEPPNQVENFILKSQHGYGIKHLLRYVNMRGLAKRTCYHPAQRINTNSVWIAGQSYQESIYNQNYE